MNAKEWQEFTNAAHRGRAEQEVRVIQKLIPHVHDRCGWIFAKEKEYQVLFCINCKVAFKTEYHWSHRIYTMGVDMAGGNSSAVMGHIRPDGKIIIDEIINDEHKEEAPSEPAGELEDVGGSESGPQTGDSPEVSEEKL